MNAAHHRLVARLPVPARRALATVHLYALATTRAAAPWLNAGCNGAGCNQGRRPEACNCHLRSGIAAPVQQDQAEPQLQVMTWVSTSDLCAWVEADTIPPAKPVRPALARRADAHLPDDPLLPLRPRDWLLMPAACALASSSVLVYAGVL